MKIRAVRTDLQRAYHAALAAVAGRERVEQTLPEFPDGVPVHVVATGKAADGMLQGAVHRLGARLNRALLITKHEHASAHWAQDQRVQVIEAGHPVPDQASLDAGRALLEFIEAAPSQAQLLFLISGGTSSLVEVLPEGWGLGELSALNQQLLANGLDIHAINRIRRAVSRIKGGRLARFLAGRRTQALLISDVAGDDPAVIGSGLLVPARDRELTSFPDGVILPSIEPAPAPEDSCFRNVDVQIIASNAHSLEAAQCTLENSGSKVYRHDRFLGGDVFEEARQLVRELDTAETGMHLWGGEPTLVLPVQPGRGGRMQSFALRVAELIDGRDDIVLLAAGTDGTDGPTEDAGALVDGETCARIRAAGLDPADALARADAGTALEAAGDLIRTGPTGTNVMDVIIGLKK